MLLRLPSSQNCGPSPVLAWLRPALLSLYLPDVSCAEIFPCAARRRRGRVQVRLPAAPESSRRPSARTAHYHSTVAILIYSMCAATRAAAQRQMQIARLSAVNRVGPGEPPTRPPRGRAHPSVVPGVSMCQEIAQHFFRMISSETRFTPTGLRFCHPGATPTGLLGSLRRGC